MTVGEPGDECPGLVKGRGKVDVPIEELQNRKDSMYQIIIVAARRARQLVDGAPKLTDVECSEPTTVALWEIAKGKIKYKKCDEKPKE